MLENNTLLMVNMCFKNVFPKFIYIFCLFFPTCFTSILVLAAPPQPSVSLISTYYTFHMSWDTSVDLGGSLGDTDTWPG